MDPQRERIQADLRGMLAGQVRCDDVFLQMYASDASIYEVRPLGVVRPRGTTDVVACVQYAHQNGIPIHARGAGTGLAGESLGAGLVVDFSHAMRRIIKLDDETVRVQPGVVHAQLNHQLARQGRLFGPDPANSQVTTMGSVLALDASGSYWLRYGSARRHVESMHVVLSDGETLELGNEPLNPTENGQSPRRRDLVGQLTALIRQHAETISAGRPKSSVNRAGYHLWDVLGDTHLDVAKLLAGSEGTLALITEATLRTEPLPAARGVALLFFDRLDAAARAALEIPGMGAVACDLMDRRLLTIARESDLRYQALIPSAAEAMLLVEFHGEHAAAVRDCLNRLVSQVQRQQHLAFDARTTLDAEDLQLFWNLPQRVVPMLYRLRGTERPLPFVEDIAISPQSLPEFLRKLQDILKRLQVTASLFAHAGHGQLHIRPFLDLSDRQHQQLLYRLAEQLYEQVSAVGGTVSGEHGDGLSRTPFLQRQYGPLYEVFREVKRIFDPRNIFNPGKVVGDDPLISQKNLRPVSIASPASSDSDASIDSTGGDNLSTSTITSTADVPAPGTLHLLLNWDDGELAGATRTCNGCGHCRTLSPSMRMCPIFRFAPAEESSPRAKANLLRGVLTGRISSDTLHSDALKEVADLCVHCHQCRLECPANVDIPRLMAEAKGQYVATNGLSMQDWFLTRLDQLSAWGSLMSPFANWALSNRQMRWLLERWLGIAQGRKLPRLSPRSFLRIAARQRLTRPTKESGRKVLYFVDLYANWYDVQLAQSFVAVLQHNGVSVFVHPDQHPAGMHLVAMGAQQQARKVAAHNVTVLAEAIRQGYHVVATEPSAALCLRREYPMLLGSDDAHLVAENSSEACSYLWRMHQQGQLQLNFKPTNATLAYHLPCHLKALDAGSPGENLLRLITGLDVRRVEKGCSGMAGIYGLRRQNYRSSLRAGWELISALRQPQYQVGTTECSTCKMQMEQGTAKPTIHPIKLLALAYGLMPEFAALLGSRNEELVVT